MGVSAFVVSAHAIQRLESQGRRFFECAGVFLKHF